MLPDAHHNLFEKDMPLLDAPAFVRRAREVEAAWTTLLETCARERMRLLEMPGMRLARLFALAPRGEPLPAERFESGAADYLAALYAEWQPRLRTKVAPARSAAGLARAAADLRLSFERFNRRWLKKLNELDLARINELRDGYNRYYLLEKECALRSTRIAREGFVPLEPITVEDLLEQFPLLRPV